MESRCICHVQIDLAGPRATAMGCGGHADAVALVMYVRERCAGFLTWMGTAADKTHQGRRSSVGERVSGYEGLAGTHQARQRDADLGNGVSGILDAAGVYALLQLKHRV